MFYLLLFRFFIDLAASLWVFILFSSFVFCVLYKFILILFFSFWPFCPFCCCFVVFLACFFHGVFSLVHVVNDLLEFFIFKSAWERLERLYGPRSFDLMSLDSNSQRVKVGQYLPQSTPCATSESSGINVFA